MATNLYVTATDAKSGKSAVIISLMYFLLRHINKVGFFRPIILDKENERDHDINLILSEYKLDMQYEETYAYTMKEAKDLINNGQSSVLIEGILNKFKELEKKFDFILCEGTDFDSGISALEFDINAEIALNLSSPVILVSNGQKNTVDEIASSVHMAIDSYLNKGVDVFGSIVNRTNPQLDKKEILKKIEEKTKSIDVLSFVLPEEPILIRPTIKDVQKAFNAEVLYGNKFMNTQVDDFVTAAMQIPHFLEYVQEGNLIIVPGDRAGIIFSALIMHNSAHCPNISGILLTGGIRLDDSVAKLIDGWSGTMLPILLVQDHTFKTTEKLNSLRGLLEPGESKKISTALAMFETNVDVENLRKKLISSRSEKITPKMFEFNLIKQAKSNKQRIVLPEGTGKRILQAADILHRRDVAELILLGDPKTIKANANQYQLDLNGIEIIDPTKSPLFEDYAQTLFEMRKKKGMTEEVARDTMADPTYFGTMMVHKGDADGMVSGSQNTTAHTIRPAFQIIKTKPGASIVSSVFLMCLKDKVLVFGDCAVNPNPDSAALAEIAISSAQTAKIFGIEPRVAMLSYSTGSSGKGEDVDRVIEATKIAKEKAPDLLLEGPIQYDAAVDMSVAKTKLPDSKVAGQATVFIFPDLNTGNNTYKAVQRSAEQAIAIGPVLQGLNKPVNDLSRGCTVADIVNTVAITAVQAQAEKAK